MKKYLYQALCAMVTVILVVSLIPITAYAQDAEVLENTQAVNTTIIQNPTSVYIEASTINTLVETWDEDIAVSVETGGAIKGYITVNHYNPYAIKVKVLIQKGDIQYFYDIKSGTANLPLQMGDGLYTIIVYKNAEGTKYKRMTEITLKVDGLRDECVYTNSIQMVDYAGYKDVVDEINKLLVNAKSNEEKVKIIHNQIINNFSYSSEKAENVQYSTTYLPDLRDFVSTGKGICYDFASLFAAVLRSNGIPTKLVMGYRTDIVKGYHAWNEVLLDGKWITVDTTVDAALTPAGNKVVMAQDIMAQDSSLYTKSREF